MTKLPYGRGNLLFKESQANRIQVFTPKKKKAVTNPQSYVNDEVSRYFEQHKTFFSRYGDQEVCIVVSDNTRLTFNHMIVPCLLRRLEDVGVKRKNIFLLVANGLHAPMSDKDLAQNLGKRIVDEFRVENHNPDANLVSLGTTTRGTPLLINRHYLESDLRIATGLVAPHFHAGFGGGCKSILPGISGRDTILKNHCCNMISHDRARYGITENNPIYEDIMEAGLKSRLDLIVNVAVDSDRKITHLFIGYPKETHNRATRIVTEDMKIEFDELFDIVVTTNGGFPLDRNLYQCVKGVAVGELMVKEGGTIILAAECRDGVGHGVFQKYMSYGQDAHDVLDKLRNDEPVEDQDNIQILARAITRANVEVVTDGVEPEIIGAMKMKHAPSISEALRSCGWARNTRLRMAIVPGGPYVLPVRVR